MEVCVWFSNISKRNYDIVFFIYNHHLLNILSHFIGIIYLGTLHFIKKMCLLKIVLEFCDIMTLHGVFALMLTWLIGAYFHFQIVLINRKKNTNQLLLISSFFVWMFVLRRKVKKKVTRRPYIRRRHVKWHLEKKTSYSQIIASFPRRQSIDF